MPLFKKPTIDEMFAKKNTAGLIKALRDPDAAIRRGAASALQQIGDPQAIEPLIASFNDNDIEVRKAARIALVKHGTQAVPPLIKALNSQTVLERLYAAWGLGEIGDSRAVEPLAVALKDADSAVRQNVVWGLGEIGDTRAVESLITALGDADEGVCKNARIALTNMGSPIVEQLIAALKGGTDSVRMYAAWVLGDIGDGRAIEVLIAALHDKLESVRNNAAYGLGHIPNALALEPLIASLHDEYSGVRQNAAWALGEIKDKRALDQLTALLKDKEIKVRQAAANSLDKFGWQPDRNELGALYWITKGEWGKCVELGSIAAGPLVAALNDADGDVYRNAYDVFKKIQLDANAIPALETLLQHPAQKVLELSIWKLEGLGWRPSGNQAELIGKRLLSILQTNLSVDCIGSLGIIGSKQAIEPLIKLLVDTLNRIHDERIFYKVPEEDRAEYHANKRLIGACQYALGKIGAPAIPYLLKALIKVQNYDGREELLKIMERMPGEETADPLINILQEGDRNEYVVRALIKTNHKRAVEPLLNLLHSPEFYSFDYQSKYELVNWAGESGDSQAVEPLINFLHSSETHRDDMRKAVIKALGRIGNQQACSPIIDYMSDVKLEEKLKRVVDYREYPQFSQRVEVSYRPESVLRVNWSEYREDLQPLFGDYTGLIVNLFDIPEEITRTYSAAYIKAEEEYEKLASDMKELYNGWPEDGLQEHIRYDDKRARLALTKLCEAVTPISNNLLHIVKTRSKSEGLRQAANTELIRRGNPPYDPSEYLKEGAWTLTGDIP